MMLTEFRHVGVFYLVVAVLGLLAFMQRWCGLFSSWTSLWEDYIKAAIYLVGAIDISRAISVMKLGANPQEIPVFIFELFLLAVLICELYFHKNAKYAGYEDQEMASLR